MKNFVIWMGVFLIAFSLFSCKKEHASEKALIDEGRRGRAVKTGEFAVGAGAGPAIDVKAVEASTGLSFKILRTEALGYMPRHKFFWVCLPEKESREKLERLASALIAETNRAQPAHFHSFTIHFFCQKEMVRTVEASRPFARATFLPRGSWVHVGRVPIDDYKDYVLTYELLD